MVCVVSYRGGMYTLVLILVSRMLNIPVRS